MKPVNEGEVTAGLADAIRTHMLQDRTHQTVQGIQLMTPLTRAELRKRIIAVHADLAALREHPLFSNTLEGSLLNGALGHLARLAALLMADDEGRPRGGVG